MTYLDSSFLVSVYGRDANSPAATSLILRALGPLIITSWAELETVNAFELRVFRREASRAEAEASRQNFETDLHNGVLEFQDLPISAFYRARELARHYSARLGTRGSDVLHVAAALELGAGNFLTFDLQQKKMAKSAGLAVNP